MRTSMVVASSLALALALSACEKKTAETTTTQVTDTTSNAAADAGNAIANAADDVKEAVTPTPTGQEFVDKAAKSDAFEIASAKLAATKATSADLKSFATMMIADHTASTAKVKEAAAKATPAIKPDAALTDDQNEKLADLGKLTGKDFDKKYADQQVDAHQDALSLMSDYADHGDVASLKAVAGEIKPKVAAHLDKIKAINSAL